MKTKFMALLFAVVAALGLSACGDDPVATVNGVDISKETYQEYIDYTMSSYGLSAEFTMTPDMAEGLQTQVIDSLVYMEELKQACEEVGCAPSEDEMKEFFYTSFGVTKEADYKTALASVKSQYGLSEETMEMTLRSQLYAEKLEDYLAKEQGIEVADDTVKETYEKNPENYDTRTVSHILIMPKVAEGREAETDENGATIYTDEEWAEAKEKAESLIKELDGGADFATLAKENSDDTGSAESGGALGDAFTKTGSSFVEEFTNASFELTNAEQYTETPVKSTYGYHIILCTGIQDKDHDFDGLLETVKDGLLNEKKEAALSEYMEKYDEEAEVVINYGSNAADETEAETTETTEEKEVTE